MRSTPRVDPLLFRRRLFETEWQVLVGRSTPRLEALLREEGASWLRIGARLGYFDDPDNGGKRDTQRDELTSTGDDSASLDLHTFDDALAVTRAELTPERLEYLSLVLDSDDDAWDAAVTSVRRVASQTSLFEDAFGVVGWCLYGTEVSPQRPIGTPADWRGHLPAVPANDRATRRIREADTLHAHLIQSLSRSLAAAVSDAQTARGESGTSAPEATKSPAIEREPSRHESLGQRGASRRGAERPAPRSRRSGETLLPGQFGGAVIVCQNCGTGNRPGAVFCVECGTALSTSCPECGHPIVAAQNFCSGCGAALSPRAETEHAVPREASGTMTPLPSVSPKSPVELRNVSVMFVDLVGHTPLSEAWDPEDVRDMLGHYFVAARSRRPVRRDVEKFIGDAVMAVWGASVAREDDAERAVRAALELIDAVAALGEQVGAAGLRARAGIVTGQAGLLSSQDEGVVVGDRVNTAARIQAAADAGSVFVDEVTRQVTASAIVFEDAGHHSLKGKAEPLRLWRRDRGARGRPRHDR